MVRIVSNVKQLYNSMLFNVAGLKGKLGTNQKAKKWVSYGDSITASNGWQPAVAAKLGLIHTKRE